MPVPIEALIPFGIITTMFVVTGSALSVTKYYGSGKHMPRYSTDYWDQKMMERDRRLTGSERGQAPGPMAPLEFATNSVIYLERQQF